MEVVIHYGILLDILHSSLLLLGTHFHCRNSIRASWYVVGNLRLQTNQEGSSRKMSNTYKSPIRVMLILILLGFAIIALVNLYIAVGYMQHAVDLCRVQCPGDGTVPPDVRSLSNIGAFYATIGIITLIVSATIVLREWWD